MSDIHIRSMDGERIPAHRIVLSARCAPLQAMLSSGMAESDRGEVMLHYPTPVVKALLEYLYTGSLTCDADESGNEDAEEEHREAGGFQEGGGLDSGFGFAGPCSPETAMALMDAADQYVYVVCERYWYLSAQRLDEVKRSTDTHTSHIRYTLPELRFKCGVVLESVLDADNLGDLFRFSRFHKASHLEAACISFFLTSAAECYASWKARCDEGSEGGAAAAAGGKGTTGGGQSEGKENDPPHVVYREIIEEILTGAWRGVTGEILKGDGDGAVLSAPVPSPSRAATVRGGSAGRARSMLRGAAQQGRLPGLGMNPVARLRLVETLDEDDDFDEEQEEEQDSEEEEEEEEEAEEEDEEEEVEDDDV